MTIQTWTWHNAHDDAFNTSIQHPYDLVYHLEKLGKPANDLSLDILPAKQTHAAYSWLGVACPLPSKEISAWITANIPLHIIEADSQDDSNEDIPWNDRLDFHAAVNPDGQPEQNGETPSPSTKKKKKPHITYRARKSSTTSRSGASTSAAVGRKPLKLAPILQFRDFLEEQATQASQRYYSPPPAAQVVQKEDAPANPKKRPVRTKAAVSEAARPGKRQAVAPDKGKGKEKEKETKLQPAELLQMHARTRLKGFVSGIIHDQTAEATTSISTRATRRMHAHPVPFPIQAQAPNRPARRLTRAGRQAALDRGSEGDTQVIDPATFLLQEESTEIIEDFSSAAIVVQNDGEDTEMDTSDARPAAGNGLLDEPIDDSREISFHQDPFNDSPLLPADPVASISKLPPPPQALPPAPPLSSSITSTSFTSASSSLNFQYVPLLVPPATRGSETVFQSTGLAPPPDPDSNQNLNAQEDSNMDIDTSARSVNKSAENKMPAPAQSRRSPRQKQEQPVKMTLFARKSTRPSEILTAKSKGKQREESVKDSISLAAFLRLAFEPPSKQQPSKRLKEAEEPPHLSRPCIPKYIPFRTLTSPIPLSPIVHSYVDSEDLHSGGIFGSGYLGPGRRGYWILPLTACESPLLEQGEHRPSQGVVMGLSGDDSTGLSSYSDDQYDQIIWTYTRLRVFLVHLRKMAQSSRWGFMDVFPAPLPFSSSSSSQDPPYCIKICIASSMALMLRSALSEFACRLHARTREELEEFADDTDADAGNAGRRWLDSKNGIKLVWWDEIDRREILLA